MAGFLNPKQRVMDVIITQTGRLQMVKGEFDVKYVSFSDTDVEYEDAGDGILADVGDKLFFEAFSTAGDEIIPEIDNLGKFVIDQKLPGTLEVTNGVLKEQQADGSYRTIDGYSKVTTFTANSKRRFQELNILNTISSVDEFSVSYNKIKTEKHPYGVAETNYDEQASEGYNGAPPLSVDPRFENKIIMRFLPPVSLKDGNYLPIRAFNKWTARNADSSPLDTENLKRVIKEIQEDSITAGPDKCNKIIIGRYGSDSYEKYNILGQVFVAKQQSLKKYTIIDAGEYFDEENEPICKIYYLGFVVKKPTPDGKASITKFDREFTIVFHNGDI